jgi:hypothetical protein
MYIVLRSTAWLEGGSKTLAFCSSRPFVWGVRHALHVPYEIYGEFRHPALVTKDAENHVLKSSLIS